MLTRFTLKRIDPLAAGKVSACLYLVIGVLQAAVIAGITSIEPGPQWRMNGPRGDHLIVMGMFLLAMPVVLTVLGFAAGILIAILYNWAAQWTGGLELEMVDDRGLDD